MNGRMEGRPSVTACYHYLMRSSRATSTHFLTGAHFSLEIPDESSRDSDAGNISLVHGSATQLVD